ncbi:MAG: BamA/TamA family outer membrane protein [Flavobacteriaceae bacterium]
MNNRPAFTALKTFITKIGLILFVVGFFQRCSITKKIPDQQQWLERIDYRVNDLPTAERKLKVPPSDYQPNAKLLGIPLRALTYQLVSENSDEKFQSWIQRRPKRAQRLEKWLSKKQIDVLGRYHNRGVSLIHQLGEKPTLIDSSAIQTRTEELQQFYKGLGYLDAQVDFQVDSVAPKKAALAFDITTNKQYYIGQYTTEIESDALDSLYKIPENTPLIRNGQAFEPRLLELERKRLIQFFRDNGVYNFQSPSVRYQAAIDSLGQDNGIDLTLKVSNLQIRANDTLITQVYHTYPIKSIAVYIGDNNNAQTFYDQDNISIHAQGKLHYKPQALLRGLFMNPGDLYSDSDRNLSYRYFSKLQNFKYPSIGYRLHPADSSQLEAQVFLSPKERFSLGFDLDVSHSNIQDVGIALGTNTQIRNTFRRTEIFKFQIKANLGASQDLGTQENQFFNLFELGGDLNLNLPHIRFPFSKKDWIDRASNPSTRAYVGLGLQQNIGLDKEFYRIGYEYNWQPRPELKISWKWLDALYVNNRNADNYFNVYRNSYERLETLAQNYPQDAYFDENGRLTIPAGANLFSADVLEGRSALPEDSEDYRSVLNITERQNRLSANNLILGNSLSMFYSTKQNLLDETFWQLHLKTELIGNLLHWGMERFGGDRDENGFFVIDGVQASRYAKAELNYVRHLRWGKTIWAFRAFGGLALPIGNANSVPFARSFFTGGSNENRGWKVYQLGPGSSDNNNEFNEANMKLAFNAECRFDIFGKLKGAFFADLSNIWNVQDNVTNPKMRFDGWQDLDELALGTGFGLRYDFDFFVFRLDTGFKTYNPIYSRGERWGTDMKLNKAVFNIGINYPF